MVTALLNGHAKVAEDLPLNLEAVRLEVGKLSTEQLYEQFSGGLRLAEGHLLRLGVILLELEDRGETASGDKTFLEMLRSIGRGELLPQLVVRFAAQPVTLACLRKKPVEEQRRFLAMTTHAAHEAVRKRPRSRGHASVGAMPGGNLPTFANMTRNATAQDAADMCLEIVMANENPADVALRLLPKLQEVVRVAEAKKKKKVAV